MIEPFEAAWQVHQFLASSQISYVVIGGLAVLFWGEPRLTRDVDLTVLTWLYDDEQLVTMITGRFASRVRDPLEFVRKTRMILIQADNGCEVDISLGIPGYEEEVVNRAVEFELEPGKKLHLVSAEDLIIHKAVAGRPRDIEDIKSVVYRQVDRLDVEYVKRWLSEFSIALGQPELIEYFEEPWRAVADLRSTDK